MLQHELSKKIGIDVPYGAYVALNAMYLDNPHYVDNTQFCEELCQKFPTMRERKNFVIKLDKAYNSN